LEAEGIPCRADQNRKWYPPEAISWYWKRKEAEIRKEAEDTDFQRAQTRKMIADAKVAELKAAEMESLLIPLAVHEDVLGRVLDRVRSRIRNIPGSWADRLVGLDSPKATVIVLRKMVDDVSSTLSSEADEIVSDPRKQEIPADFPEVAVLRKGGVELFSELLDVDRLTDIPGVGPARAEVITGALLERGLPVPGSDR
jgi:phage terminase Nu1 subunit (DNA packaging protein)